MRFVALDSATTTGWAAYDGGGNLAGYGTVTTTNAWEIDLFAGRYGKDWGDVAFCEDNYLGFNPHVSKVLARITGRWQQAFEVRGVRVEFVAAKSWQCKMLPGHKKRKELKAAAQQWVADRHGIAVTEDEADAIVMGEYARQHLVS